MYTPEQTGCVSALTPLALVIMADLFASPFGALLIFSLRIVDVSMSMVRMLLAVRGHRMLAAGLGFVEVLIWVVAVGYALEHLGSPLHVVSYAAGFAAGNYVGIWLESKFALGMSVVHAVLSAATPGDDAPVPSVAHVLRDAGFAVTELHGRGRDQDVLMLNVVIPRRQVPHVVRLVEEGAPGAFVTVEDVRASHGGYLRPSNRKSAFFART